MPQGATGFLIGVGATLLSKMINIKAWSLINNDPTPPEVVTGQFPATSMTRDVTSSWSQIKGLNRQSPILQFISGELEQFQLGVTLFRRDASDTSPTEKLEKLIDWVRVDPKLRRPPTLVFALGGGIDIAKFVVLEGVVNVRYGKINALGGVTQIDLTLNMRQIVEFDLDDKEVLDTRYATVKDAEYYEMLAWQEYRDPALGIIVRQRSGIPLLAPGDRVAMSAIEGVRTEKITQRSIALKTAYGKRPTEQQLRRIEMFSLRNRDTKSYLWLPPIPTKEPLPTPPDPPQPQVWIPTYSGTTGVATLNAINTFTRVNTPFNKTGDSTIWGQPYHALAVYPSQDNVRAPAEPGDIVFASQDNVTNFRARLWSRRYQSPVGIPMQPLDGTTISNCILVDDEGYIWIGDPGDASDAVYRLDPRNPDSYVQITGVGFVQNMIFDSARRKIFVCDDQADRIRRIDVATLAVDATSTGPTFSGIGMAYCEARDEYMITQNSGATSMAFLDPNTMVLTVKGATVRGNLRSCAYDPVNDTLWAGAYFDNVIVVIDASTGDRVVESAIGGRPCGILYEPYLSAKFGETGHKMWIQYEYNNVQVWDIDSRIAEDTYDLDVVNDFTGNVPIQMAYSPHALSDPQRPMDPAVAMPGANGESQIALRWRAGSHNDITAGKIDRLIDLSGNGYHGELVGAAGTRADHNESDAIFGGHPSMSFVAANLCHYRVGGGVTLGDLVGTGPGGGFPGDMFTWMIVFSYTSLPVGTGSGSVLSAANNTGIFGAVDPAGNGAGFFGYQGASQGRLISYLGNSPTTYKGLRTPVNTPGSLNVPRCAIMYRSRVNGLNGHYFHWLTPDPTTVASTGGPATSGVQPGKATAPIEIGKIDGAGYADVRIAEVICWKHQCEWEVFGLGSKYLAEAMASPL